jgi:hypothetical protein
LAGLDKRSRNQHWGNTGADQVEVLRVGPIGTPRSLVLERGDEPDAGVDLPAEPGIDKGLHAAQTGDLAYSAVNPVVMASSSIGETDPRPSRPMCVNIETTFLGA